MAIPHLKITETMRNKYYADAKNEVIDFFEIDVNLWGSNPLYYVGCYGHLDMDDVLIKFYKTARGDKRMSIPKLRKVTEAGDYVWFTEAKDGETIYYNIHIGKELPFDEKQYVQLQERFG
jgi:hypothetical protein